MAGKRVIAPEQELDARTLWEALPEELLRQVVGVWLHDWARCRLISRWFCRLIDRLYLTVDNMTGHCRRMSDDTLRQFPNLQVLYFDSPRKTPFQPRQIQKDFTVRRVKRTAFTLPVSIAALSGMQRLRTLWLEDCNLRDNDLAQLTQLTALMLQAVPHITSRGLARLTRLTRLTLSDLDLRQPHAFDLSPLRNLTALDTGPNTLLPNCLTSLTALQRLRCSRLPRLAHDNCLTSLVTLHTVDGEYTTQCETPCLRKLRILVDHGGVIRNSRLSLLTNLTELSLQFNPHVSDEGLASLTQLTELTLYKDGIFAVVGQTTPVSDAGLCRLTALTHLDLMDNTTCTIDSILCLKHLTYLAFHEDSPVARFVSALPSIKRKKITLRW